jgi:hypothetical protein
MSETRPTDAALVAQLVEALADLLREAEDGHAVCAYTRFKAREALRVAKEGTA